MAHYAYAEQFILDAATSLNERYIFRVEPISNSWYAV